MLKHLITPKKIPKFKLKKLTFLFSLIFLTLIFSLSITIVFSYNVHVSAGSSQYTPAAPSGNTTGNINEDHIYFEYTSEVGSYWMFDWGDGNFSDWILVEESDTFVSQIYSWSSYGVYEVRIKHKSAYMVESNWSPPLIVTISVPTDLDNDGWKNDVEESYGKNPEDPNDYPLDTDGDGKPDDESIDGYYEGDFDDDNDGLSDISEEYCKSDPKVINYVIKIEIESKTYYIVDTNRDEIFDILFNPQLNKYTNVKVENGITYLDITDNGLWDYTYDGKLTSYESFPWLYLILGIIFTILIILFILFKIGILFLYDEEYIVED